MKWFRFWTDTVNDVKMLQLSDYEYRMWTYLLSYLSEVNSTSGEFQITFKLLSLHFHQRFNLFSRAIETFQRVGLITVNEDGYITVINWNKRQFRSDDSYARVKKFREVTTKRNVSMTVSETVPDTDTDTDTEKDIKKAVSVKPKRAKLTDEEFLKAIKDNPAYRHIDLENELSKMDAWFLTPKGCGRQKTRRFIVNWLNKIDKPIGGGNGNGSRNDSGANRIQKEYIPDERPEVSDTDIARVRDLLHKSGLSKNEG